MQNNQIEKGCLLKNQYTDWNSRLLSDQFPFLFESEMPIYSEEHNTTYFLMVTLGIRTTGIAEIIGYSKITERNKKESYYKLLLNLVDRGLHSPILWVGPDHDDFSQSILEVFRKSDLQHCIRHKIQSLMVKVNPSDQVEFHLGLKRIFSQPKLNLFIHEMNHFRNQWNHQYAGLIEMLEEQLTFLMTFFKFPVMLHPYIKSSIILHGFMQKINREISSNHLSIFAIDQWLNPLCQWQNMKFEQHPIRAFLNSYIESTLIFNTKYHAIHA